jgi:MinD-like ATPase involved in chromosome partitioning or flagellar assembly
MRKELFQKYQLDYLFLDTSPGIRYWSVNTLAAADVIFVLMKDSDMDVEGTRRMINDIYDSLTRFGAKYYIILNKVPGAAPTTLLPDYKTWTEELERVVGAQIIGSIPCFCDIQFNRHEYLFSVKKPEHAFSKSLTILAEAISKIS